MRKPWLSLFAFVTASGLTSALHRGLAYDSTFDSVQAYIVLLWLIWPTQVWMWSAFERKPGAAERRWAAFTYLCEHPGDIDGARRAMFRKAT